MRILRFKNNQPEWEVPLPELAPEVKSALRIQWREFIHEVEDAEGTDNERIRANFTTVMMFERAYKAS
jgi:hypothetical protein